jgi:parallel beta-helix repeat protein
MKRQVSCFIFCLFAVSTFAANIYVDANGTGDYPTIQAAINDANDDDTIILQPGTYTGSGNRDIDFLGKAITVRSTIPQDPCVAAATIINCQGSESEPHRGFNFHTGEDSNSVVSGLNIINGHGLTAPIIPQYPDWTYGGGIYCNGSGPTIADCVITNNKATEGAGIFACYNSNPVIAGCTISQNIGPSGGGIYLWKNSTAVITDCIINGNDARGIYIWESPYTEVNNCQITFNDMYGIAVDSSDANVSNCTISGNNKSGIVCGLGSVVISNCLITGNSDDLYAGGIRAGGNTIIKNSTIAYNLGANMGGGIYCELSETIILNSIVGHNFTTDIYIEPLPPPPGATAFDPPILNVSYSCPGQVVNNGGTLIWGYGNIDTDPCFVDPNFFNGDFHLQSQAGRWDPNSQIWVVDAETSPCIDAGNPGCPPAAEPDPNGNRINMGAYGGTAQASKSPAGFRSLSDLNNDWDVDFNDLAIFVSYWLDSGTCLPSDLDRDNAVDFEDYAVFTFDPCSSGAVGEPEIVYQIEDCDIGFMVLDSDSNDFRFTVTVEGQHILFEDMMVANCCPDELELQMTVEDNLITINEVEYLSMPCTCICDYPVSAILGPFAPGTYTLEVYQEDFYGGFIGSTIVIID